MSDDSDNSSPRQIKKRAPRNNQQPDTSDREIELLEENNNLRRKLKRLSAKLDDELEKASMQKLKAQKNNSLGSSPQSQNLELKNAYKMIERLQKTVRDYEANESYQISAKRVLDLQSIIKKKQLQIEELKTEIKVNKKTLREREKHIDDLIDKQAVNKNLNEEKQQIAKLKELAKKLATQNDKLKKVEMDKHRKLVTAERRIVEMEQEEEQPIGIQEEHLKELEQLRNKYKEAMVRIQKQNVYITKLNSRLSNLETQKPNPHRTRSHNTSHDGQVISRSVDELPDLRKDKINPSIFHHIPSPNIPSRLLRRY